VLKIIRSKEAGLIAMVAECDPNNVTRENSRNLRSRNGEHKK
jgi:hypothetical protein